MSRTPAPAIVPGRAMSPRWIVGGGMLGLGIGYFAFFTPYTALARAVSEGRLPGMDRPVRGLELLPPAALGLLASMVVFLAASGWWRLAGRRQVGGVAVPFPGRATAASAFFMALIVGTTTLNFTFAGISILFVLVLERLETIVLAPGVDLVRRRRIHRYSWVALGLCALAAVITLADVDNYRLTLAAAASILTYLAGYSGRFTIMSKHAKTGGPGDRRYFVEEHMSTPVVLVLILAVFALIGQGPAMQALRTGFTAFLTTPAAPWAFAIGVAYEGLFIFTTHIFLDRREFAFGMPVHVCASLLAGVAATFALRAVYGTAAPSHAQFVAAACVLAAAVALSYPALRARLATAPWMAARARPAASAQAAVPAQAALPAAARLLFVCGSSTDRSPMAASIARAELDGAADTWLVDAAGLDVTEPGKPMSPQATDALRRLNVAACEHRTQPLTRELCDQSTVIYTMTAAQRDALLAVAPAAAGKTHCLDPAGADLPSPHRQPADFYHQLAQRIQTHVRHRLAELPALSPTTG
jgi:protein-tyrosine-phosphatase